MGLLSLFSKNESEQKRLAELEAKVSSYIEVEQKLQSQLAVKEKELLERSELISTLIAELNQTKKAVQLNGIGLERLENDQSQKISELIQKQNELLKENQVLKSNKKDLKSTVIRQKDEHARQLAEQKLLASLQLVKLNKKHEEKLSALNDVLNSLKIELQNKDQMLNKMRAKEESLTNDFTEQYDLRFKKLQQDFTVERENYGEQIDKLKRNVVNFNENINSLKNEQQQLQGQHEIEMNSLSEKYMKQINQLLLEKSQNETKIKKELQDFELERKGSEEQINQLKQRLQVFSENLHNLKSEQQQLREQHEIKLNSVNEKYKKQIEHLHQENDQLAQKLNGLDPEEKLTKQPMKIAEQHEQNGVNQNEIQTVDESNESVSSDINVDQIEVAISSTESLTDNRLIEENDAENVKNTMFHRNSVIKTLLELIPEHGHEQEKKEALVTDELMETPVEVPDEDYNALNQTIDSFYDQSNMKTIKPKVNPFYERIDEFEKKHVKQTIKEIVEKIPDKLPSRYQVAEFYEDGWHSYGSEQIHRIHEQAAKYEKMADSPYFGRIDVYYGEKEWGDTFYIGLHDVNDSIISWQTDAASIYYDKKLGVSEKHPTLGLVELDYLRNIDIENRKLVKLHAPLTHGTDDSALVDALSNKRGKEMDIIVATIQKEQNELIRLPINNTIVIQGSAGSGKSVIALHRISYLLYKYKNLKENSVAIFGPNELFLGHIQKVLPELGNYKVIQATFAKYVVEFLKIKPTKSLSMQRMKEASPLTELKGSIAYKEYIGSYGQRVLNNTLPWLSAFTYIQDGEQYVVESLDIGAYFEVIKDKPYYDRKNTLLNWILQKVKEQLADREEIKKEKVEIIEHNVNQWISQLITIPSKYGQLSDFQDVFSEELLTEIKEYGVAFRNFKLLMERPNLTPEMKKGLEQSIDEKRKQAEKNICSGIESFLFQLTPKVQELMNKTNMDFLTEHVERAAQVYIETKRQGYIKSRLSEQIIAMSNQIIIDLRESLKQLSLENNELKIQAEFSANEVELVQDYISTYIQNCVKEILELFLFKAESRIIRSLNEAVEVEGFVFRLNNSHEMPTVTNYTADINSLTQEINKYFKNRFIDNHTDLLRIIRKDEFGFHEDCVNALSEYKVDWSLLNKKSVTISYEDLPSLLHTYILMRGESYRSPLSYLILDEAQDYLPYEIWAISKLTKGNRLMLIGDIGQNLNPSNHLLSWKEYEEFLENVSYYHLSATYRSTKQIVEVSNQIIHPFSNSRYQLSEKTYRDGPEVKYYFMSQTLITKRISTILKDLKTQKEKYESIAIIVKNIEEANNLLEKLKNEHPVEIQTETHIAKAQIIITTPIDAKGLEFDCVIIADLSYFKDNDYDRKLAYVATSRALHELIILHSNTIEYFK